MKKNFLKVLCCLAITCITFANASTRVLAKDGGNRNIKLESTVNSKYTLGQLSKLSYDNLVDTLSNIRWNDITDLMQYNEGSREFYSDNNRVQALIDALIKKGREYTANDDKGIPTLIEVLRGGYYLGFYNKELKHLDEINYKEKCIPAMLSIENNPNFSLGSYCQNEIIKTLGLLIGNTTSNNIVVNKLVPILKKYNDNIDESSRINSEGQAIYNILNGVNYSIESYLFKSEKDIKSTSWFSNIDEFINEVERLALLGNVNEQNSWIINNGIYYTGKLAKLHSNKKTPQGVIEKALKLYPYLGEQYFKAIESIKYDFNETYLDGNKVNIKEIKEQGKKRYLTKTYTFDNGKMIIKTGDKVSEEKVKRLYWASKEVKAQFHRVIGNDEELEKGNADDVLNIVIYNNPEEYKLNSTLYGYSTDNGGIYIENIGTFFTYERTSRESIFSLEELFRHEFTHYLQGRYLVPGIWGQSDFYRGNNCRLTWFEEGSAEFFAGSTRENNILPRKSEVRGISNDISQRFSSSKLLHSKYGSFDFYNYGFAFSDYMYNNNIEILNNIINYVKNNDVKGYEDYIESLSTKSNINSEYQYHMQKLVDNYDTLTTPLVSDEYIKEHPRKSAKEIYSNIEKVTGLKNIKTEEEKGQFFNTFTLKGTYIGDRSKGKLEDWNNMNSKANEFLKILDQYNWSGYKTLTCYFVNHRVNKLGQVEYDVIFHGILTDDVHEQVNKDADIDNKDLKIEDSEDKKEITKKDSFENAYGPLTSDNKISGELKENDKDIYYFNVKTPGNVDISVKNKDNAKIAWQVVSEEDKNKSIAYPITRGNFLNGKFNASKPGKYYIMVYRYSHEKGRYDLSIKGNLEEIQTKEVEDNNSFEKANKVILNSNIIGETNKNDYADIYTFNVLDEKEVNIKLTKLNNAKLNWVVYNADNLKEYVSYAKDYEDTMINKFIAKPGKYYLYVYRVDENGGKYKISIR
ncbi:collagenase [Clostridium botulinum C]|uniref:collagenase n=1 Tax=Clostridium botulinum TaxID=1491 RepID=UPI001E3D1861|nr:collagenase [Clostridium botulinum]MCD3244932.1 collagenase [Clostridium botulinum C]MCD3261508.1 collagenase [Clostridium botulinum C]